MRASRQFFRKVLRSVPVGLSGTLGHPAAVNLVTLIMLAGGAGMATAADAKKPEIPEPEDVSLKTKDGVTLYCRYFPGTEGKKSVPVILLHGWGGQWNEYDGLATGLQRTMGHAVMVPDLRGHGRSTQRQAPGSVIAKEIQRDRMRTGDIQKMSLFDLEAVKKFLLEKHNAGELNIEMLCVVGAEMGAVVAMNWTAQDWSWPQLPTLKQGQDVKAFVLISPPTSFKGVKIQAALAHPAIRSKLSAMIVYGDKDSQAATTARRIYKTLERHHPPRQNDGDAESADDEDLVLRGYDTSLQGTNLLNARSLSVKVDIARFIHRCLTSNADKYVWEPRENPFGN